MALTALLETIHSLEPGARVELIEVDCRSFGGDILRFHNYNVDYTEAELNAMKNDPSIPPKGIVWQGETYTAWPYELTGIEWDGTGKSPQPSLTVANQDGSITSMCYQLNNLYGAKVIKHTTFRQFMPGQPEEDSTMEFRQVWFITRKASDNIDGVSFELSSPADFSGQKIPRRQIHALCHWAMNGGYRGPDCGYTGTKYFTDKDVETTNPALDVCPGLFKSCELRFGKNEPTPFGGFIAATVIG
ncbi:tail constituent protein [Pseudomonas phage phiPMW]|uniref:Tail constituent protein n=1 Tax=Pseudomonas phage phiPMW TaxID=1815582 RepID=A0A1S5R1H6_9CAUD|nr:minor tail protein [Pseudomonas phage phiPMW]ANA49265.1 tail constituent protein [Pseudomonas phage phiPMW]